MKNYAIVNDSGKPDVHQKYVAHMTASGATGFGVRVYKDSNYNIDVHQNRTPGGSTFGQRILDPCYFHKLSIVGSTQSTMFGLSHHFDQVNSSCEKQYNLNGQPFILGRGPNASAHSLSASYFGLTTGLSNISKKVNSWIPDSDATAHMTIDSSIVFDLAPYTGCERVVVGSGMSLTISYIGTALLCLSDRDLVLRHVFVVPDLAKNLLSITHLVIDLPIVVIFSHFGLSIQTLVGQLLHPTRGSPY
ncbi:hypothetical protein HanIR_Chr14g0673761 [Helianthus annuus]|nr:hypothetical protein HanIR_Chr14g0673761 [Helianthus annuus]